ncbi:MAG: phenylalanine--tRNA ligase subunit alpha [Candidatus Aenigmarchaeota archaeon]|nr:phenylalanine--tRNA ligase subunit alpha [Candidatus Aenigmarchaeota archaeon]
MKNYELTREGEEYSKNGLPERNLVKILQSSPGKSATIDKIANKIKNFNIALKWSLEKGWVSKKGNHLTLLKVPEKTDEEVALKNISEGKDVDENTLKILMQRNLVVKITETYKKAEEELVKSGNVIGELTHDIIRTGLWKSRKFKEANVDVVTKKDWKSSPGKQQPYNQFLWGVRKKLIEMGFKEMAGPLIETEFWNFDALFQPQNHPARDWTQTYSLKYPKEGRLPDKKIVENVKMAHEKGIAGSVGWQYRWDPRKAMQLMPRAHGTCLSARTLAGKPQIPGRYFAIARCYRPDVIDATHGVEFNQTEGIVLDKNLTFKHLLGILKMFAIEIAGAEKVKFLPDYYPFTSPSCQLSALHPELGWIEFGGSGIFREELTRPLGVNVPVLAWGIGIDRLAMFKLKIKDIRELFSRNLEWLREKSMLQ